jgi:ABC-2 type transport system permease protein
MLRAGLYIMWCSARNRMRRRIQRLREPRYLTGAAAGVAYLYFAIFSRARSRPPAGSAGRGGVGAAPTTLLSLLGPSAPALASLLLLLVAAASWIFPIGSGLLNFSRAEKQFLFPAPVSRRWLVAYRLLRAQLAVLISASVLALFYRGGGAGGRLRSALGIWMFLMTCHLYFAGVTLARRRPSAAGPAGRWIGRIPFLFTIAAMGTIAAAVGRMVAARPVTDFRDAWDTLGGIAQTGLPQVFLWPFTAVLQPFLAVTTAAWIHALPAAALVLLAAAAWVLRTGDVLDTGLELAPELQPARGAARRPLQYRSRPSAWVLGSAGRAETAFVWKGAMQTFRVVDWRLMLRGTGIVLWLVVASLAVNRARGFTEILGVLAVFAMGFTVAMGPQILRADLRQDLEHLELLKTWPVRAASVVRGELIWPTMVVTTVAWACGIVALTFSAAVFSSTGRPWRMAVGTAAMILTPALVLAQYTIHNAAALVFPAWIHLGAGRARGVDAIGQRLILLGGTWLTLVVLLLPGVIVGGGIGLALYRIAGPWVCLPGALCCAAIIGIELVVATEALGPLYERLDVTSVERAE